MQKKEYSLESHQHSHAQVCGASHMRSQTLRFGAESPSCCLASGWCLSVCGHDKLTCNKGLQQRLHPCGGRLWAVQGLRSGTDPRSEHVPPSQSPAPRSSTLDGWVCQNNVHGTAPPVQGHRLIQARQQAPVCGSSCARWVYHKASRHLNGCGPARLGLLHTLISNVLA